MNSTIIQCTKMKYIIKWTNSITVIFLVIVLAYNSNISATETQFYKGAVVTYMAVQWNGLESLRDTVMRNTRRYITIIEKAGNEKCDILVFPEGGLTSHKLPLERDQLAAGLTFIPNINTIPCEKGSEVVAEHLQEISCAAKKFRIYVVINLYEKKACDKTETGCPADGLLFYNTNVVFDREGKIIATYRKQHLFIENEINTTSTLHLATFHTDFRVTFGMFTCFDILFYEPAGMIIEKTGVKNIIYPTAWYSEIPFNMAVEIQASYSYLHNVNLLASAYNWPDNGPQGSGIYAGKIGPALQVIPDHTSTTLLIATILSQPTKFMNIDSHYKSLRSNIQMKTKVISIRFNDDLFNGLYDDQLINYIWREDFGNYTTKILNADQTSGVDKDYNDLSRSLNFSYEQKEFKCYISVEWNEAKKHSPDQGPVYRLIAYKGERSFVNVYTAQLEVCGVIACQNEDLKSCGYIPDYETGVLTNITSISISLTSSMITNAFPRTSDKNLLALLGNEMHFSNNVDQETEIQSNFMVLESPRNDLLAFGIYKTSS